MSSPPAKKNFGIVPGLRAARESRGFSQGDLANLVGVEVAMMSHMERGIRSPSVAVLIALADHLGSTVDELLGRPPAASKSLPVVEELKSTARKLKPRDQQLLLGFAKLMADVEERGRQ